MNTNVHKLRIKHLCNNNNNNYTILIIVLWVGQYLDIALWYRHHTCSAILTRWIQASQHTPTSAGWNYALLHTALVEVS